MRNFVLKLLGLRISLPSALWVISSLTLGIYILVHHAAIAATPLGAVLFTGPLVWSILLVIGDALTLLGVVFRPPFPIVRISAALSFAMWCFFNIAVFQILGWNLIFAWVMPFLPVYIYIWLADSVGFFRKNE